MSSLDLNYYLEGFKQRDRSVLAKAITLIESQRSDHQEMAEALIDHLNKDLKVKALRVGISGTPGVGKSSFINQLGFDYINNNKKVAILAIDPTSQLSGGSILGDKTRMNDLINHPDAFIRPTPSGKSLGGVAHKTREVILLCEAFGFDLILVETVGVGQSEVKVSEMVDYFLMLLQPGAGDELQGIKRGILEHVDMIVITKIDLIDKKIVDQSKHHYLEALKILRSNEEVEVLVSSIVSKHGFEDIKLKLDLFFENSIQKITEKRKQQLVYWFEEILSEKIRDSFFAKLPTGFYQESLDKLKQNKIELRKVLKKYDKYLN